MKTYTKAYLYGTIMIFSLLLMGGCEKSEAINNEIKCPVNPVIGSETEIVGTWKLVKGEAFSSISRNLKMEDYSCNHIVYQFNSDGMLVISSDTEDYIGHIEGEYTYKIIEGLDNGENQRSGVLEIDDRSFFTRLSSSEMAIEVNPVNPLAIYESKLIAHFVRIE